MVALSIVGVLYFASLKDSRFLYWVFEMNQNQAIIWSRLWTVVYTEILTRKYAVSVALIGAGLLAYERSWKGLFRPELLLLGAAAVAGISAISTSSISMRVFSRALKCGPVEICRFMPQILLAAISSRAFLIDDMIQRRAGHT